MENYFLWGIASRTFLPSLSQEQTLALSEESENWSLTTLRETLVQIGAKVARHARYITIPMAPVAVPKALFAEILRLIDGLRPDP